MSKTSTSSACPSLVVAWRISPGTVVTITLCENVWCRVSNAGRSGYILRNQIWGTYPNEPIGG